MILFFRKITRSLKFIIIIIYLLIKLHQNDIQTRILTFFLVLVVREYTYYIAVYAFSRGSNV